MTRLAPLTALVAFALSGTGSTGPSTPATALKTPVPPGRQEVDANVDVV